MREYKINIRSPFLEFKVDDNCFIYDGGIGVLSQVTNVIYDVIKYLKFYDIRKDYEVIMNLLRKQYTEEKINYALKTITESNEHGFLRENSSIYDSYKMINNLPEDESYKGALWLNVSHDCNLRCTYCYADCGSYGDTRELMTKEIAKNCIDYWFQRINKNQKLFDIMFFGGEPFMNINTITFAINYINDLTAEIGAKARYNVTTNGTIYNEDVIKLLSENQCNLMISLDGLKEIHNNNRPYVSGKGSFNDIVQNVKNIKKYIPILHGKVTVKKKDVDFIVESVKELWDIGINSVYADFAISKDEVYEYEDYEKFHEKVKELAKITYKNIHEGKKIVYEGVTAGFEGIRTRKAANLCSLFSNGSFVFSPNGDIYKCHRFVGNEEYKLGNLNDKNLNILGYRLKKKSIEKCSNCWAQLLCGDGCPFEHKIANGDINKPSEDCCNKVKIHQKETLKLYARLLINQKDV
jgi:uncharacterized protein